MDGRWSTTDFSIAAYLHSLGVELHSAVPESASRNNYRFVFLDEHDDCSRLVLTFLTSVAMRFDQSLRALKKVAYDWSASFPSENRGTYVTEDMSLAAWFLSNGIELVGFRKTHRTRREYKFYFVDTDKRCDGLALGFVNSQAHRYDQSQRILKKLVLHSH